MCWYHADTVPAVGAKADQVGAGHQAHEEALICCNSRVNRAAFGFVVGPFALSLALTVTAFGSLELVLTETVVSQSIAISGKCVSN